MIRHEVVSHHEISKNGIEVDKAKIEVKAKLPKLKCIQDLRSFLGYTSFYRRFIKNFSKIDRPLTNLLVKDVPFTFDSRCLNSWEKLKNELISALIISAPDWSKSFEIICDASNFAIGVVLGQHIGNNQHVIYYSSRTSNDAQLNYTTIEKKFLMVCIKEILSLPTWVQNHHFYRSFCADLHYGEEGCQGPTNSLDLASSRIRSRDSR